MMNRIALSLFALLLITVAPAQDGQTRPTPSAEEAARLQRMLLSSLKELGVEIDREKQTVTIPAWVNDPPPPDPIEYLLVHKGGKKHEAIFVTEVKASLLNAALIMLGYDKVKGNSKNVDYKEIVPAPTQEQVEKGAPVVEIIPPQGQTVFITIERETAEGKKRVDRVEDYVIDLTTGEPVKGASWVYLGGQRARLYKNDPEVFVGDFEGNLVSTCYMSPPNHLVTMRHQRASDDHNWVPNPAVCPPPSTKVKITFRVQEPVLPKAESRPAK